LLHDVLRPVLLHGRLPVAVFNELLLVVLWRGDRGSCGAKLLHGRGGDALVAGGTGGQPHGCHSGVGPWAAIADRATDSRRSMRPSFPWDFYLPHG